MKFGMDCDTYRGVRWTQLTRQIAQRKARASERTAGKRVLRQAVRDA